MKLLVLALALAISAWLTVAFYEVSPGRTPHRTHK